MPLEKELLSRIGDSLGTELSVNAGNLCHRFARSGRGLEKSVELSTRQFIG